MRKLIALLILCAAGCNNTSTTIAEDAPPPPDNVKTTSLYVYNANIGGRLSNLGRWYNYIQFEGECPSGSGFPTNSLSPASCFNWLTLQGGPDGSAIESKGPWWIDSNHKMTPGGNGYGLINVIAFAQVPLALHEKVDLENTTLEFSAKISADYSTVIADSLLGTQKSHIYFWFQTSPRHIDNCTPNPQIGENCTRQSDYILTGNGSEQFQIDNVSDSEYKDFSFGLNSSEPTDWVCLGSGDNVKYECANLDAAFKNIEVVGFIAGPVQSCPTKIESGIEKCDIDLIDQEPELYFNTGTFYLKDFKIVSNYQRPDDNNIFQLANENDLAPADGWSPIKYSTPMPLADGAGIHIPIIQTQIHQHWYLIN